MSTSVRLSAALTEVSGGIRDVQAEGETIADVISSLDAQFPGISAALLDDSGLRRYVNIYVGGTDVRYLKGLATPVPASGVVTILPAVAGG